MTAVEMERMTNLQFEETLFAPPVMLLMQVNKNLTLHGRAARVPRLPSPLPDDPSTLARPRYQAGKLR
jgi:hypothetical protein